MKIIILKADNICFFHIKKHNINLCNKTLIIKGNKKIVNFCYFFVDILYKFSTLSEIIVLEIKLQFAINLYKN